MHVTIIHAHMHTHESMVNACDNHARTQTHAHTKYNSHACDSHTHTQK